MKDNNLKGINHNTNPSSHGPSTFTWARLPDEPADAYTKFRAYLRTCCGIAGEIVEAGMLLNLEILPYTADMQYEMLCDSFHWRERVPSFFAYLGKSLRQQLDAERAQYMPGRHHNDSDSNLAS